ncbi:MAG: FAD-binding protein [Candidatus Omnitrophica bacterium]|nr:FAD-binding protein [Candidatus Omnitrophota bacterium]
MLDVVIVGAGIAGLTSAVYAARKRMKFAVLAKEFGGQFYESGEILNYPSIKQTTGAEFARMFEEQIKFNGIAPRIGEEVTGIAECEGGLKLRTKKDSCRGKTVILATGSRPRKIDVPGEDRLANKGVTYCSICDGPLFSGQEIAIVGGGNSALEGVDFTHNIAKKIYVLNVGREFTAHEYLSEKITQYPNVEVIHEAETTEITGDTFVDGIVYRRKGKEHRLAVRGVIIEIGRIPNTDFLKGFLDLNEKGHIRIDCQSHTSKEGIFAAGDCASGQEFQYAIAAGQGCIALLKAARYLANKK